ncbi:acid protease [Sistotremastrum suecicum HHB10207 ss-3]|uniref:Acid protease n=1 Tax=Sistotremastrum suecicum HHB10207 ss-3 TaxID=1314776 RepID=A0A166ERB3_9AGAM|nr:acid protease [Sistotremastrum suecicum HHB10207 ss-3]
MTRSSLPLLVALVAPSLCLAMPFSTDNLHNHPERTPGAVHLPIYKRTTPSSSKLARRSGQSSAIGLGDDEDITYNVIVKVGPVSTPVVLDTGSSDLWVISDACTGNCTAGVPLYPMSSFNSSGLDAQLLYGDSQTGTHAFGPIGSDTASVAGLSLPNQFFAAINNTNASVLQTGSAGIFGLGFPINSVIFSELFKAVDPNTPSSDLANAKRATDNHRSTFPSLPSKIKSSRNYHRSSFPTLPKQLKSGTNLAGRQNSGGAGTIDDVLASFATNGPLISRLAELGQLSSPQMTITLQRDSVDIGGNVGLLSIGDLPQGISNDSLTWVPIRAYTQAQGGLPAPADSPNEVYPIAWEVPIDNVFLDGVQLPTSNLSDPSITLTALVDTGNSLIRGPQDVTNQIMTSLTGSTDPRRTTIPCSASHNLAFQIGGQMFPIDPRDFVSQDVEGNVNRCDPNLVSTDPPSNGFLYSWSLGDPFLKSVLVSFYYGNLTHPSVDPPRMGFLSTVPQNAAALLSSAIASASADGNLAATSVSAPSGLPTPGGGYGANGFVTGSSSAASSTASPTLKAQQTVSTASSISSTTNTASTAAKTSGATVVKMPNWFIGICAVLISAGSLW